MPGRIDIVRQAKLSERNHSGDMRMQNIWQLRPLVIGVFLALCLLLHPISSLIQVSAQDGQCDPNLSQPTDLPYGYRDRGNRCEGIYIKEVKSTTLFIASFTEYFQDYDLKSGKDLLVDWKLPSESDVFLRAYGLRRKLYYRMDTVVPSKSISYTWPVNILDALNIKKTDIGVIGWIQYPIGETEKKVYLPLRIKQQEKVRYEGSYLLVLLPGQELQEVYISLAYMGKDGISEFILRPAEPLGYGYYPAERSIAIPISNLETAGIYYLEIGATLKSGGSSTVELWFYHPQG